MAKSIDKNLIIKLILALVLVFCAMAIIFVCTPKDIALADYEVVINITNSNLEADYNLYERLLFVDTEIQFADLDPLTSTYDYAFYIKKSSDADYPAEPTLIESVVGNNSFYFGDGLEYGTYNLKIIVTAAKDATTYQGNKVVTFNVTKAVLPAEATTFEVEKIVYGEPLSAAHDLGNSYGVFSYDPAIDLTEVKTPGTYTFTGTFTPSSDNYQVAYNVEKTIEVTKRTIKVLIDNKYSYIGEPLKELTYHVYTDTILPGEEDAYTLSFALDREVTEAGEYYIIGTLVSDLYQPLFVNTDHPEGTMSVTGIYKIYSKVYDVVCIDDIITDLRILRNTGFGLDVEIVLVKTEGRFEHPSLKEIGEYKLIHYYQGQATIPEQNYVVELTLPKYAGKEVVVKFRNGEQVITQTYIPDANGVISFQMDTSGEFALFAEELPSPPSGPDKYISEVLPYDIIMWISFVIVVGVFLIIFRKKKTNL